MIITRKARPEEIPVLAQIGQQAWRKGIGPLVPPEVVRKIEANNPFIPFLSDLGERILVAEIDHKAAGFCASENDDDSISDLWVSSEFEGRGVGTTLLQTMEQAFLAKGFRRASLSVAAGNHRAHGLYLHLGYVEIWRGNRFDPILEANLEKMDLVKSLVA